MNEVTYKKANVTDLKFDVDNPRLVEFGLNKSSLEDEIIKILWEDMDAKEIAMSIQASGFFQNDPLIITEDNIVIEGNRRLAAVKVLCDKQNYSELFSDIPVLTEDQISELTSLPVVTQSREEAWKFLGFKHVNGPAKWGSYAKAKYIANVHNNFNIPLKQIGIQIGDTHGTVQKLYRGLMVIEQAERTRRFNRNDIARKSFPFSHLYIGLQREGIRSFLDLRDATEEAQNPVPDEKLENLIELTKWLFGSKSENIEPIVQSQNPHLGQLDRILQNREAVSALRAGESLELSLELTQPASSIFEEQLLGAKRYLVKAKGLVSEGYDKSIELLKIAGSIANLADALYEEMERKKEGKKKERISEEE